MATREQLSLFELQTLIKNALDKVVPLSYWVAAEISELKVNYSGHCYLELVEKGGGNQIPLAKANAVIWRSTFGALNSYFVSATGRELAEGMKVLLRVSVSYHELYGLSLVVADIDPSYTLGDMERQRQQTIRRLTEEGVFDMNRMLALPTIVQRVAVISSRNAAGYQDFMNELSASGYHFGVTLFDAFMQGNEAETSIISALELVAADPEKFDVVVIIRGGGSQSDLGAFDSYRLSNHIAQFPLPVITGIGHDKDESVADLVANLALKTPTAVARWLSDGLMEFERWLDTLQGELLESAISYLDSEKRRIRNSGLTLSRTSAGFARMIELRLEKFRGGILRGQESFFAGNKSVINRLSSALCERAAWRLSDEKTKIELAAQIIRSRHPENILALGFAIVRKNDVTVRDSRTLVPGDMLDITFASGKITANVKSEDNGKKE